MNYTKDQQSVIDIRGKNILVSAAAGSGKTAVLVERIIKMVSDDENPVDIDRLLVLTFTNLAAGEMRERISQAISKKLELDIENTHLQKQLTLLHNAQITTIDSFCLFILRNHFHAIGLDPGFRVADEGELKLLKKEVIAELLEFWYEAKNDKTNDFLNCVEYFTTGNSDADIEKYIEKLYDMAMSFPWPEDWLIERKNDYQVNDAEELLNSSWMEYLLTYVKNIIEGCIVELEKALKICTEPDGPYMYSELLEKELQLLFNLLTVWVADDLRAESNDEKSKFNYREIFINYLIHFKTITFTRLPSKKDDSVSADKREQVKSIRKLVKEMIAETGNLYFSLSPEKMIEIMNKISPAISVLVDLALDYKFRLDQAKREKNIIDFSDMEHFALDILWEKNADELKPSAIAKELKKHFITVMTDEYQDSNQVQELLLKSISAEDENRHNRFMVGDVKQSIYKFRLARPEIFMEKYHYYPQLDTIDDKHLRIDLNQNFRSRENILTSINYIFERIMQKSLGGIEYDKKAALYPGATYPDNGSENQTELLLLNLNDEIEDNPLTNELITDSKKELEARMIARRIREMMAHFKVTDKESGALRPLAYRDIVILLRTTKDWDELFKKTLNEEGIPAITASRSGYFATKEIQTILQLVSILDNPQQDIPLFGVMKSFFGDFTDEEIAIIKTTGSQCFSLYDKLNNINLNNSCDLILFNKITKLLKYIEDNRHKAIYTPIADLLRELVIGSGYYHHIAVRPDGEQRVANLEMLLKKAASFAETSYYGLFHFVRYIEQLEKYDVDYGEANILDEFADVVRLMSIHKSKGLEFPVCFVAGLHKRINLMDSHGVLCLDVDLGLGVDYIDPLLRVRRKNTRKNIISQKIKLDSLGEELRILYVAMTRAKEKLILTGITSSNILTREMPISADFNSVRPSFLKLVSSNNFLDLLMPLILSEADNDIFTTRIWTANDLVSREINEIMDLNQRRDFLLASLSQTTIELKANDFYLHEKVTQMSEKLAKPYPYANLAGLYAKTTVSELKKANLITNVTELELDNKLLFEEPEVIPYIPQFMKEDARDSVISSGSERGSAYHKVMELIDFALLHLLLNDTEGDFSENIENNIKMQIEKSFNNGRLPTEYREAVAIEKIIAFFMKDSSTLSLIAKRMMVAANKNRLFKEQPFVIGIDANRLNHDLPIDETILIQGIIDVFFEEQDELIILDYKSDAVKTKDELIVRYGKQLEYYQEALEQLTGKKVKEKLIYSFSLNETVVMVEL